MSARNRGESSVLQKVAVTTRPQSPKQVRQESSSDDLELAGYKQQTPQPLNNWDARWIFIVAIACATGLTFYVLSKNNQLKPELVLNLIWDKFGPLISAAAGFLLGRLK